MTASSIRKAKKNGVPVWCGEFGAINGAPTDARKAWLRDVRTACEKAGIGWCMWDYAGQWQARPLPARQLQNAVSVNEEMVGHKFGEFSPTRTFHGHSGDKKAKKA